MENDKIAAILRPRGAKTKRGTMKTRTSLRSVVLLGATVAVPNLMAEDSNLKLYGFADALFKTQWYSDNNILRRYDVVEPGGQAYLDHANLYFDSRPNSSVRFLAEVSLNRDPKQAVPAGLRLTYDSAGRTAYVPIFVPELARKDHGISIARAHADLLLADEFNIRLGKFITPAGIWNVDHGSPTILTVRQPYQTNFVPIFPESQTGLQAFGKTQFLDQDFSYSSWVSTGRGNAMAFGSSDYGQVPQNWDDWAWGSHLQADLALPAEVQTRIGASFHTGTLRMRTEWMESKMGSAPDLAKLSTTTFDSSYSRELCYGLDGKILWKGFLFQTEWNHRMVLDLQDDRKETNVNGWYILLAKTVPLHRNVDITPYAMFESVSWDGADNNRFLQFDQTPVDGFQAITAGLNFGLFSSVHVKAEYSHQEPEPVRLTSGSIANNYTYSDLAIDEFDLQLSVAF